MAQETSNHLPDVSTDPWTQSGFQDFNIDDESGLVNGDGTTDTTGNGLYWFWDSIWSEPKS